MTFGKIKSLLFTTSILVIVSMSSKSIIAISFEKQSTISSHCISDDLVEDIARAVDYTDLQNRESVFYLSQKLLYSLRELPEWGDDGSNFQGVTIVRVAGEITEVVDIADRYVKIRTFSPDTETDICENGLLSNYSYSNLSEDISEDKYGRSLKYIWVETPTSDFDLGEIATVVLNDALLAEGYMETATYVVEREVTQAHEDEDDYDESIEYC